MGRKIMRSLKLDEISAVDTPAQAPATMAIMKRGGYGGKPRRKGAAAEIGKSPDGEGVTILLTDLEDGHQHSVRVHSGQAGGSTSYGESNEEEGMGHDHEWVLDAEGNIILGMNRGHNHGGTISSSQLIQALMAMASSQLANEAAELLGKSQFTTEKRDQLVADGRAMDDGSFPIVTKEDLGNAISAFGRASNKGATARHIARQAEALDASDMLPSEGRLATLIGKSDNAGSEAAGNGGGEAKENGAMPKEITAADLDAVTQNLETLKSELALAKAFGVLTDVEKAHYATLGETEQGAFLSLDATARKAAIEKAQMEKAATEHVVYKDRHGNVFTKADDPRFVIMAQNNDELAKANDALVKASVDSGLRKRAETEYSNLPGTVEVRMAMIKSAEDIPDEGQRTAALEALKASNDAMAKALATYGYQQDGATGQVDSVTFVEGMPVPAGTDPFGKTAEQSEFEKGVTEFHKTHTDMTYEKATLEFAQTTDGSRLYTAHTNAHAQRAQKFN